jgi:CheY-like chemotaxis protein
MLGAGFADIGRPVVAVLVIVVVLVLVIAAVVFPARLERVLTRLTWWREEAGPATAAVAGVLWVDDRPEHNARLLNGLREQGVPVEVARTMAEAVERLGERAYTIIVADMSRADHPGDDLRPLEQASGTIPVVVFSRYASTADAYRERDVTAVSSEAEIREWLRSVDLLP